MIGAGPVGLAAAAHLLARGLEPLVFEAGDAVGASIREWGHVRVFSPWEFNLDPVAAELLDAARLDGARRATATRPAREIVERYLEPLAATAGDRARACTSARAWSASRGTGSTSSRTPAATRRRSSCVVERAAARSGATSRAR